MNEPMAWQTSSGGHPPHSTLLLYLEGELDRRDSAVVADHIRDCWICRTECDRLNQGMYAFVKYREDVLEPVAPPPPPTRYQFSRRLRELAAARQPNRSLFSRIPSFHSHSRTLGEHPSALFAVAISAAVGGVLILCLLQPPTVTAEAFLNHAQLSSNSSRKATGRMLYQRVEFRQGQQSVLREVYFGHPRLVAQDSVLNPELSEAIQLARIDWDDPLSATRFAEWRNRQTRKKDFIFQTSSSSTLRTTSLESGPTRYASLTVRLSDWHPVSEHVEFRDRPALEIRELAFEIRPIPAEVSASVPAGSARNVVPHDEAVVPSEAELENAEVQLREVLHALRADVEEVPTITKQGKEIHIRAFTRTPERRQEILAAVEDIPYVTADVTDAERLTPTTPTEKLPASGLAQPAAKPLYSSDPPLAKRLNEHFGGFDLANSYLAKVRDSYFRILVDSSALKRLAERYSSPELERLSPESRARLNRIATDHLANIRRESNNYLNLVTPVLDEMISLEGASANAQGAGLGMNPETTLNPCVPWQDRAIVLSKDLQSLQTPFQRLFVVDQTDAPLDISAEGQLRDSALARAAITNDLRLICQL